MAEIDHIPGEHIPQGVIPQKRVGQYSFLIRSYAIYKGQGKTLDGSAYFYYRYGYFFTAEENRCRIEGQCLLVGIYCTELRFADRFWGIHRAGSDYVYCPDGGGLSRTFL